MIAVVVARAVRAPSGGMLAQALRELLDQGLPVGDGAFLPPEVVRSLAQVLLVLEFCIDGPEHLLDGRA